MEVNIKTCHVTCGVLYDFNLQGHDIINKLIILKNFMNLTTHALCQV